MSKDASLAFRLSRAERILVVAPHWVGDAVMTLGLLQALKTQDSGRDAPHISVLCSKGVAAVYRASPVVSEVIEAPFAHGGLQFNLRRQTARLLKQRQTPFTTAYILPNSFKTALIPFWAGILNRIGYGAEGRGLLLTKSWPKPSKAQKPAMLDWYGRLGNVPTGEVPMPVLLPAAPLPDALKSASGEIPDFLAAAPGAEFGPAKRWPQAHFAATIAAYLSSDPLRQAVLLGGPKDIEVCSEIVQCLPEALRGRVKLLAGKTSLDEAITLIGKAQVMLTNDSGLMHVAAAMNVPQQAVFGSSDPRHTPPLSQQADIHWLQLPCSPCFQRTCPLGHTECLQNLTPERVIVSMNARLASSAPTGKPHA